MRWCYLTDARAVELPLGPRAVRQGCRSPRLPKTMGSRFGLPNTGVGPSINPFVRVQRVSIETNVLFKINIFHSMRNFL